MNTTQRIVAMLCLALLVTALGCESEPHKSPARKDPDKKPTNAAKKETPKVDPGKKDPVLVGTRDPVDTKEPLDPPTFPPEPPERKETLKDPPKFDGWDRKELGQGSHVWLELKSDDKQKRRVLVGATVCLREGEYGLECLLCKRNTKEHESILATSAKADIIHTALLAAGGVPGQPVRYEPKFKAPQGQAIKITLVWEKKGQVVSAPAQQWVRNSQTKKDLELNWVFAGSRQYKNLDEPERPGQYGANVDGGYITICNLGSAMLDLPINSPKAIEGRSFTPHSDRIPDIGTFVTLILEPIPEEKKK